MFKEVVKLIRPQQWSKNIFIVAPLFFTPAAVTFSNIYQVFFGVICFNILASAIYILNDTMDREADRQHPTKCKRPLAAGTVPLSLALCGMVALTLGGLTLAYRLTPTFFTLSLLYLGINLAYSLGLKKVSILDIMLVAFGFVLRVFAGASLIHGHASEWIIVCTGLVALFIALAKRRDDIVKDLDKEHRQALAGYNLPFLDAAIAMMLAGLLIAYLIYTVEAGIANLYLTTPFVIMGVLRYLQIALVEHRSGSPTAIVLTDRFLIGNVMAWIVSFGILLYGR